MSIDNNEGIDSSLPSIPPSRSANTKITEGMQILDGVPALSLGEPPSLDPVAAVDAKANWQAAKERAVHADHSAPSLVDQNFPSNGRKDQQTAAYAAPLTEVVNVTAAPAHVADVSGAAKTSEGIAAVSGVRKPRVSKSKEKAPDAVKRTKRAGAVAKAPPKTRSTDKVPEAGAQDLPTGADAAEPARSRRTKVSKAMRILEQGLVAAGSSEIGNSPDIPPMTDEALTFLRNADATVADLFKLQPESQRFVQYHVTNMQRMEAELTQSYNFLMATSPKYSPQFEQVADALVEKLAKNGRAGIKPSVIKLERHTAAQEGALSYRPIMAKASAYQMASVQLGTMELGVIKSADKEQAANVSLSAAEFERVTRVMGSAHVMISAPIGDITRQQADDLVTGDIADVREIREERLLKLALIAMAESSNAQPHYRDALENLAPELAATVKARAAISADRTDGNSASHSDPITVVQHGGNTIERGIEPDRENSPARESQEVAPSMLSTALDVMKDVSALGFGRRMLHATGMWLMGKAEERPTQSTSANVVPANQTGPVTSASDNSYLVPDSVAQRFLKVEQDYYFHDKTPAFSDRGTKLATRGVHPEVVRSLIDIAIARGWGSIVVKGTDEFRRSAWLEAAQAGLRVAGFKPTALDLADLATKPAGNSVEEGVAKDRETLDTNRPSVQPVRTMATARAQEAMATKATMPPPSQEHAVKARAFDLEKPGFVIKKFPELAQAYGVVDAARKFAAAYLSLDVRDEFIALARRHVMQKILAGEHVKGPQIYTPPAQTKAGADRTQASTQREVVLKDAARSREMARDR
jgi:hypothetical protein